MAPASTAATSTSTTVGGFVPHVRARSTAAMSGTAVVQRNALSRRMVVRSRRGAPRRGGYPYRGGTGSPTRTGRDTGPPVRLPPTWARGTGSVSVVPAAFHASAPLAPKPSSGAGDVDLLT